MTAKQLEQETGCKIMVRGKGSMRDKKKVNLKQGSLFAYTISANINFFLKKPQIIMNHIL